MSNHAIAEKLLEAIEAEDVEQMRKLYAPDAKIWHDFDRIEQDPDTNIQSLLTLRQAVPDISWQVTRIESLPEGFLLTYNLTMTLAGRTLAIPACVIGTVANGLITRLEEWINASSMLKRMSPEQLQIMNGE